MTDDDRRLLADLAMGRPPNDVRTVTDAGGGITYEVSGDVVTLADAAPKLEALVQQLEAKVLALRAGHYQVAEEAWTEAVDTYARHSADMFRDCDTARRLCADGFGRELDTRDVLQARIEGLERANKALAKAYNGDRSPLEGS